MQKVYIALDNLVLQKHFEEYAVLYGKEDILFISC